MEQLNDTQNKYAITEYEVDMTKTCATCETELLRDENRECLYCPECHPLKPKEVKVAEPEPEIEAVDITEDRVRDIVREELAKNELVNSKKTPEPEKSSRSLPDWQQEALALGIQPFGKKKEIILAKIEEKKSAKADDN